MTMAKDSPATARPDARPEPSAAMLLRWGGLASFLLAVTFVLPELIYLMGNLREANGPLTYALADLLYGPLRAACLVLAMVALRELIGERAPRRMSLVQGTTLIAAAFFVGAALIRASNRHYHLIHPELNLEASQTVLVVWTTLVAGLIGTAWHILGWSLLLLGWAGWTSGKLPRPLSLLYLVAGCQALFVYLLPALEGNVVVLGAVLGLWQGWVLWNAGPGESLAPERGADPAATLA